MSRGIDVDAALRALGAGSEVYLFLAGMMLLAELLRSEGVFLWIARRTLVAARGSGLRLFSLVYLAGVVVTAILSNDATAVALTPAVAAALKKTPVHARPPLFACALVANAASFVLPISNPANLVVFNEHPPALYAWLGAFALPAFVAISVTFVTCLAVWRRDIFTHFESAAGATQLSRAGRIAGLWSLVSAGIIVTASLLDRALGLTTFCCGIAGFAVYAFARKPRALPMLTGIDWGILPLVAGLFVIVSALAGLHVVDAVQKTLVVAGGAPSPAAASAVALVTAGICALINNLPAGLIASGALRDPAISQTMRRAVLIAVDLGPNLAISGSLATYLWLTALRREGFDVGPLEFARFGILITVPALIFSVLAALRG